MQALLDDNILRASVGWKQQEPTLLPGVGGRFQSCTLLAWGYQCSKADADSGSWLLCDLPSWFYVMLFFLFFFKGEGIVTASQIFFSLVKSSFFRKNSHKVTFVQTQWKKIFLAHQYQNSFSWTTSSLSCLEPNSGPLLSILICYTQSLLEISVLFS